MMKSRNPIRSFLLLFAAVALAGATLPASAAGRGALEADAKRAYNNLVAKVPAANALGKSVTSVTMQDDVYAFIFGQKGLMAGVGLQGNKITRLGK